MSRCFESHVSAALHLSASEGNRQIVELLLAKKADVNAIDRWGGRPLADAVREGHHHVGGTRISDQTIAPMTGGRDEALASRAWCALVAVEQISSGTTAACSA